MSETSTVRLLLPPLTIMLLSFILSSIPGTAESNSFLVLVPPRIQNLLHVPLFALLTWTWIRALQGMSVTRGRAIGIALLISLSWGVLDEIHQYFVPGRYASLMDMIFNIIGAVSVVIISLWSNKRSGSSGKPLS